MRNDLRLERDAATFAGELTQLLNGTICNGIRVRSVITRSNEHAAIGYEIDARNWEPNVGIPITLGRTPRCYLGLSYQLVPDPEARYLMVRSSMIGLFCDAELNECLFHYDYERNKPDGYPEAHLQIDATSDRWQQTLAKTRVAHQDVASLHLPVGGRRFRPSLEDIIEFLITERIADARPDWQSKLNPSRDAFQERQLRAAIRRRPEIAKDCLIKEGYQVRRSAG